MATAEQILESICADQACRDKIMQVFTAVPRPGPEIIVGELHTTECCFVRDEIHFLNGGRLIFDPDPKNERNRERGGYCRSYSVVCRRIRVVGGGKPLDLTPCSAEDPGKTYAGKNVITWLHRLTPRPPASDPNPGSAPNAQNFSFHATWSPNKGDGDNGKSGDKGPDGAAGGTGADGMAAPDFALVCLEVEMVGLGAHLILDWDGQVGGKGGRGQHGGDGGHGVNGRIGDSDTSWPGTGCDRQPGNGGKGGDGGNGGTGGTGGRGGDAGDIVVISTTPNVAGVFISGDVTYVNDGGNAGEGGLGGIGGKGGKGGKAGIPTSECGEAADGVDGANGQPETFGSNLNKGVAGPPGAGGSVAFLEVVPHPCADPIPIPIEVTALTPQHYCRDFGGPANNLDGTVTGNHLAQVTSIATSLAGVTIGKKASSTDTQLDLDVDILGNSALGAGSLTFNRAFGAPLTVPNLVTVQRFEVLSISPTSGARSQQINVTITGQCFDPAALNVLVIVSGAGVTTLNVAVLNATTVSCTFDIGGLASLTARDVTVAMGGKSHSLVNAFTVTN